MQSLKACIGHFWQQVAGIISFGYLVLPRPQITLKTQRFKPADDMPNYKKHLQTIAFNTK